LGLDGGLGLIGRLGACLANGFLPVVASNVLVAALALLTALAKMPPIAL
jgi:hypothetical protein